MHDFKFLILPDLFLGLYMLKLQACFADHGLPDTLSFPFPFLSFLR